MNVRKVEKIAKGFSNHYRIKILLALEAEPGLSLLGISDKVKTSIRNASEHTRKLVLAGLIEKKYKGSWVEHNLTPRGKNVLKFCRQI